MDCSVQVWQEADSGRHLDQAYEEMQTKADVKVSYISVSSLQINTAVFTKSLGFQMNFDDITSIWHHWYRYSNSWQSSWTTARSS